MILMASSIFLARDPGGRFRLDALTMLAMNAQKPIQATIVPMKAKKTPVDRSISRQGDEVAED